MESLKQTYRVSADNTVPEKISIYTNKRNQYFDSTKSIILKLVLFAIFVFIGISTLKSFLYVDIANNCYITVGLGFQEFNNGSIVDGIKLIKKISPTDYKNVCENVKHISPNIGCGGIHGGCYYEDQEKRIYVNSSNRDLLMNAAVIIHETCHSYQAEESRPMNEEECYQADDKLIKKIVRF